MSGIDLSVVIVSYNVRDLLEECIASVRAPSQGPGANQPFSDACALTREIIIIDNASSDGSVAMVRSKFPPVRLLVNTENRGFAAANNQGFAISSGRYVLMLNPDTVVHTGALEAFVEFMDANPRAGVCGGRLVYADGSFQHSAFHFPTLAQIFLDFFPFNWRLVESSLNGRYPRSLYERGKPFRVDHPLGADLLVRRQAADHVGWLDEQFFIYCEEIDWAMRFQRAGWQVWCVPQAEVVHREAQSTRQLRDRSFVNLWRARFQLFEKHYSRSFRFVANRIVRLGLVSMSRRVRNDASKGLVTQEELKSRLEAFGLVSAMAKRADAN